MRCSKTLIPTLRDVPKEAEATSHRLMLKAGLIRKLGSGIYTYLPLGFLVLQNVCRIIREEMNEAGALELLMPALHPAELWKKTGRYETLGQDKIAFKNRSGQEFVLGPTHEEIITEIASAYLKSYQQLPKILYQIQTKFRDELRPRFGIIRTKEFIMKDAYSFDVDEQGLDQSYEKMYQAYVRIFKRLGLTAEAVGADPGMMGGDVSHEFMARSPYGEDRIAICSACQITLSREVAPRMLVPGRQPPSSVQNRESFATPNLKTIDELANHFKLKPEQLVKTMIYFADEKPVAVCIRGDREVNEGKLKKVLQTKKLRLAGAAEIEQLTGAPAGFSGPVGLKGIKLIVDGDLLLMNDFVVGANQKDAHIRHVQLGRDFNADVTADIRAVEDGDLCPKCQKPYQLVTAMEVGHVFKLGTRYSLPLEATYRSQDGKEKPIMMGCYGLGVNRIVAAIIEEHHDEKGILWPSSVAPFQIYLLTVNHTHEPSVQAAEALYRELAAAGLSVLYDDRDERAGVKFHDADLIGIPFHLVVGEKNLNRGEVELKFRKTGESKFLSRPGAASEIRQMF